MAIYQMNRPASPAVITMKFHSYNAAIDFSSKSGTMKPSKPYKRMISKDGEMLAVWCVTMASPAKADKATYTRIDTPNHASERMLQAA